MLYYCPATIDATTVLKLRQKYGTVNNPDNVTIPPFLKLLYNNNYNIKTGYWLIYNIQNTNYQNTNYIQIITKEITNIST